MGDSKYALISSRKFNEKIKLLSDDMKRHYGVIDKKKLKNYENKIIMKTRDVYISHRRDVKCAHGDDAYTRPDAPM